MSLLEKLLARKRVGKVLRRLSRPPEGNTSRLDVHAGYRLWAATYANETLPCFLDDELARALLKGLPQAHLLDAGCGTGRRIHDIPGAMGIDLSPEMLATSGLKNVVAGDIRQMPFTSGRFDMVWCRLVLGYLLDPLPAYQEFFRVCAPGAYVFVTDFHPDAIRAGHRRNFKDHAGVVQEIENYVHANHEELAAKAGLILVESRNGAIEPSVRDFYIRGPGRRAYFRDFGLNLVSAYLFQRP